MPELDNPVLVDADAEKLLQMAESFDRTGQYEVPEGEKPSAEEEAGKVPEPTEVEPPEAEKPEVPEKTGKERDDKGRFTPKETKEGEPPAPPVEVKPPEKVDSEYEKAKKEQERKDKTWKQIEAEKQAVRQERAEIQRRAQEMEAERAQFLQRAQPRATKDGFTAPDYAKAAEDFVKNGDYENAYKAQRTVQDLIAYEQQFYAQQSEQQQAKILDQAFTADLQKAIEADPEVDPASNSPLSKEISSLLSGHPYLYYVPEGALRTVEIAKMRLAMNELQSLRDEVTALKAEKEAREKGARPIRPGPTAPGQARKFEDLSVDEMEHELQAASQEADDQWGR